MPVFAFTFLGVADWYDLFVKRRFMIICIVNLSLSCEFEHTFSISAEPEMEARGC